jgi:lysozyme family protein
MRANWQAAFDHVQKWEGGAAVTDDPNDPGGLTRFGVALLGIGRTLGFTRADVLALRRQDDDGDRTNDARSIFEDHFWTPCRCDALPGGLDLAVFDGAINQGAATTIKRLQRAAGVGADGAIGPVTLAAVARAPEAVLIDFMALRLTGYAALKAFVFYGFGWARRVIDTHRRAVLWQVAADR